MGRRDPGMTSTDDGSRDQNPFAFNVSQLGAQSGRMGRTGSTSGHHHRSYSSSSTASSSSLSSLPYPLVPTSHALQRISTAVPGLSISPTHTPASAFSAPPSAIPSQYGQSPTNFWPESDPSSRPSTSSSSLAAGLSGMDLNSFGFPATASPLDHFTFSPSFEVPSSFSQSFDMMNYGGSFDQNIPISFDPSSTIPEFDPSSSFIAQLRGMEATGRGSNYAASLSNPSTSDSSSASSPNTGMDGSEVYNPGLLGVPGAMEFDPGRYGEFGGGGTEGACAQLTNKSMSGFRQAQTPMAASGFGLTLSTPQEDQPLPMVPGNDSSNNLARNSSDLSALQSRPQLTSLEMGLGDPTTSEVSRHSSNNSNPAMYRYPSAAATSPFQTQQQGITSPDMTMASLASTGFGSTLARIHQPHHPSETSEVTAATMGLGSQVSASLLQMGMGVPLSQEAGAGVEPSFTQEARAGALESEEHASSLSPTEMRETMRGEIGMEELEGLGLGLFQSAEDSHSDEAARELSPFDNHLVRQHQTQQYLRIRQDGQASPQSLPSQRWSRPTLRIAQHGRSRSDTVTPTNIRRNSSDAFSLPKWNNQDLAGFGLMKEEFQVDHDAMNRVTVNAGQWGTLSPTTRLMLENPDPLEPFFNTVQERNLLMMALPSSLNPILSIHLPIILSFPETATSSSAIARGTVTSSDLEADPTRASIEALRLSLLGVASIHKSYMFAKSGHENQDNARQMWNMASRLRWTATKWLNVASESSVGCKSDAALGACVSIALIDIFAGGHNYKSNLAVGKKLVAMRGGPAAMVRSSKISVRSEDPDTPSLKGPCHFVETDSSSPKRGSGQKGTLISSARLLLEILTVYETFSTLTCSDPTTLLRTGDSTWWFEGDKSNYHLLSVEKVFGMSRSIVELFARVSNFLNRHRPKHHRRLSFGNADIVQGHLTPRPSRASTPVPTLSGLQEVPPEPSSPLAPLHIEAYALLREVSSWHTAAEDATNELLSHPRVEYGNKAHKCALIILLLREAFNIPAYDLRVQKCVQMTLSAAVEASVNFVMSVDLIWPVIIAGCQCTRQEMEMRALTINALEGFQQQCCFEIDTAKQIISEAWRRMDANLSRPDFRSVVDDLDLQVLIL
ncbi:hypothetical protein FRB96_003605 [Tulasnella sp. 330]|nr:hypothetical protein FRB96_003605 [Tulasnella sp. 330]